MNSPLYSTTHELRINYPALRGTHDFTNMLVQSILVHSPIHLFIHLFIYSFSYSFVLYFIISFFHSYIFSSRIHVFILRINNSFTHLLSHSCIHLIIILFNHILFINYLVQISFVDLHH